MSVFSPYGTAVVLMDNHFHLLVETPEGNLSASLQWLKQAYSIWHNLKHDRVGPLFQGRFKSVPVEDGGWAYELSLYLHLNPLRLARFKLGRVERQAGAVVPEKDPTRKEATRLLRGKPPVNPHSAVPLAVRHS